MSHLTGDSFAENGAGAVSLVVSDLTATSVRGALGVRAAHRLPIADRAVTPRAELRYLRELAVAAGSMRAAFADAAERPFGIQGTLGSRNAISATAGVAFRSGSRASVSADYRGYFTAGGQRHAVTFGVAF